MSTGNFYNKNASKVYAVMMNDDDYPDGDGIDEEIEYYQDELKKLPYEFYSKDSWDHNRNYAGKIIAHILASKTFGDVTVSVTYGIIVRTGYYSGANLDWECSYEDSDTLDYENVFYYSDMNAGMKKIQQKRAEDWAEKTAEQMQYDIEGVFEKLSTPLKVTARFSNGETMYASA